MKKQKKRPYTIPWERSFGAVLKEVREIRGITQEDLALLVGMSRAHVSDLERGVHEIGLELLIKLSEALKIDPSKLLSWVEYRRKRLSYGPQEFQIPEIFLENLHQREDEKDFKKRTKK